MTTKTILLAALLAAPLAARAQGAAASPELHATPPAGAPGSQPVVAAEGPAAAPVAAGKAHGIFPLWGDKVRAKGFDLPNPYSVMFNYYYQSSELVIDNLQLGFNGGPKSNFDDLIQIPKAKATGSALSVRPALMVLPFLSVYGVFSTGSTETDVSVASPALPQLAFDTTAKSGATVVTLGATFQMGYKGFFGVADFNGAVSDVERLADLVGANLLSFRLGYSRTLDAQGRKIAGWVGTAGQVIEVDTSGSVRLQSVLPPVAADCTNVRPALQPRCQELVAAIGDPNATVDYSLDKKPKNVWNMLLGAQYALDRNWAFRVEGSFLGGRYSVFGGTAYEFDIY